MNTSLPTSNAKHPWAPSLAAVLSIAVHLALLIPLIVNSEPRMEAPNSVVMVSMITTTQPTVKPKAQSPQKTAPVAKSEQPVLEKAEPDEPAPEEALEEESVENEAEQSDRDSEQEVSQPEFNADYFRNPPPRYPSISQRLKEQGEVLLRVKVDAKGEPLEIRLQQSSGFSRLDKAAQKAVNQWRFVPAKREGKAVMAWVVVPIEFSIGG